jgi:hypothetical protein
MKPTTQRIQGLSGVALRLAVVLVLVCGGGCLPITSGYEQKVLLHNATDIPVTVYGCSDSLTITPEARIAPGGTSFCYWFVSGKAPIQRFIRAFDDKRKLVFCKAYVAEYVWGQENRDPPTVEITKGEILWNSEVCD